MVSVDFTLFIQWINFGVLLFILYWILYKPLIKFLDERNAKLKEDIDAAKSGRDAASKFEEQYKVKLATLENEYVKHLDEAKKQASDEREVILEEARKEAERILDGSRKEMQFEAEKVKQELKQQVAALVINCSSQVLEREVKESDHKRLIGAFLEDEIKNV